MIAVGYVLGLVIGICLGMMGAGGAILTIPVLVYIFDLSPLTSTTYSLFIVGITAFIGSVGYVSNRLYNLKAVIFFGVPSLVSVWITGKIIMPAIPNELFNIGNTLITKDLLIMLLFSILMILSSIVMIRSSRVIRKEDYAETKRFRYGLILFIGLFIGFLTGLLGVGGGFLIIPALVILANLPMKIAIGTSLALITVNSLLGFVSKIGPEILIDWGFLLFFSSLAAAGILTGVYLSKYVSGERLKFYFGYFVLVLGIIVLGQEFFIK